MKGVAFADATENGFERAPFFSTLSRERNVTPPEGKGILVT